MIEESACLLVGGHGVVALLLKVSHDVSLLAVADDQLAGDYGQDEAHLVADQAHLELGFLQYSTSYETHCLTHGINLFPQPDKRALPLPSATL